MPKSINEYRIVFKKHDNKDIAEQYRPKYEGWYNFKVYKVNDPEEDSTRVLWEIRLDKEYGDTFRKKFPELSEHLSKYGQLNFEGEIWNKLENCMPLKSGRRTLSELIAREIKDFPNEPRRPLVVKDEKCPCSKHDCDRTDEYVEQGFHCEVCFADCVEIAE